MKKTKKLPTVEQMRKDKKNDIASKEVMNFSNLNTHPQTSLELDKILISTILDSLNCASMVKEEIEAIKQLKKDGGVIELDDLVKIIALANRISSDNIANIERALKTGLISGITEQKEETFFIRVEGAEEDEQKSK
jgi:hypothetical protein